MDFSLAKKLKDAGFPLIKVIKGMVSNQPNKICCMMCGFPFLEIDGEFYLEPVLDVLIDACGDKFSQLIRNEGDDDKYRWNAFSTDQSIGDFFGKTPSEAVANLWLELNK